MLIHKFFLVERCDITEEIQHDIIKNKKIVEVADDFILDNHKDFLSSFKAHWWYLGNVHAGLEYHGITIIENKDIDEFLKILRKYSVRSDISELIKMCEEAKVEGKYIVHFGI